jgi:hypothetical protein
MKRVVSIFVLLAVLLVAAMSLTACAGAVTREETQAASEALFAALSKEDYEAAAALFHPETATTADNIAAFCEQLHSQTGLDFSEGATIERYTGMSTSVSIGSSRYELTMKVKVGETTATFRVEVVRTDNGFGISNLHYDS